MQSGRNFPSHPSTSVFFPLIVNETDALVEVFKKIAAKNFFRSPLRRANVAPGDC